MWIFNLQQTVRQYSQTYICSYTYIQSMSVMTWKTSVQTSRNTWIYVIFWYNGRFGTMNCLEQCIIWTVSSRHLFRHNVTFGNNVTSWKCPCRSQSLECYKWFSPRIWNIQLRVHHAKSGPCNRHVYHFAIFACISNLHWRCHFFLL